MSDLAAWLASVPGEPSRAWLDAHPDALGILDMFGDQGFEACADLISLALPASCLSGECGCRSRAGIEPACP